MLYVMINKYRVNFNIDLPYFKGIEKKIVIPLLMSFKVLNPMNSFDLLRRIVETDLKSLQAEGFLPDSLDFTRITCDPPREVSHGDIATNAAMVLSKQAHKSPKEIAHALTTKLTLHDSIAHVHVAGPGFINITLQKPFWIERLREILLVGDLYGDSKMGQGKKVNVEYVSANPTGPLHVGHCRGAVFGDALCALLKKVGYSVTSEYYVNDAGAQIDKLAHSVYQRYLEALGQTIKEIEGYPGDYLIPVGSHIAQKDGDKWVNKSPEVYLPYFKTVSIDAMMNLIRSDLALLGVRHHVFTSEQEIIKKGEIEEALQILKNQNLLYKGVLDPPKGKKIEEWEPREQLLFKSTAFGDDVDRPIEKSDGTWTYFTPDIAYHYDKFKRGATLLIDILGADHAGYVKRITSAVKAVSQGKADVDVKICQLVKFMEKGHPMKMSKRAGTFIGVKDVLEKVGKDVFRFIMLTRKNDASLDFDFAKVVEKSKDNPVFYVHYAYARIHSVKRHLFKIFPEISLEGEALSQSDFSSLDSHAEETLIKTLCAWPRQVEIAALAHEPHRLAFYLYDLCSQFHGLWNRGKEDTTLRFIHENNLEKTRAKMALLQAVANVIASGLTVFGVETVEEM